MRSVPAVLVGQQSQMDSSGEGVLPYEKYDNPLAHLASDLTTYAHSSKVNKGFEALLTTTASAQDLLT